MDNERTNPMIIDSHQHPFWHGRDEKGLIADMDEHGIEVAWLLSWVVTPDEDDSQFHDCLNPLHMRPDGTHAGIPLADLVTARDRYPDHFVLGYCPHPLLGDAPGLLESAYHIHGVRVCGEWKCRMLCDDPRCLELFRKAGELGCPVVLHMDVPYLPDAETGKAAYFPLWYGGTVKNLERALVACPETIFLAHGPGCWREISGDADRQSGIYPEPDAPVTPGGRLCKLLDTYPNLYGDLSAGSALFALKRDPDHAKQFLCRYADRLLFGRDEYGNELNEFLQSFDLPRDVQEKLYFRNATSLVELPKVN